MKILTKSMLESKNFQRFSYPKDMDKEMIDFIDVLNNIPGCRTLYCCQGHGDGAWYFVANCCNMFPYKAIRSYAIFLTADLTLDLVFANSTPPILLSAGALSEPKYLDIWSTFSTGKYSLSLFLYSITT